MALLWSESEGIGDIRDLRSAVKALELDFKIWKSNTAECTVWLPARGDVPIPSSPLIGDEPDRRRKRRHRPFPVQARLLKVEEWLELAAVARDGNIPGTGVVFGASVYWNADLIRLITDIVTAEAFLPGLRKENDHWQARWQPMPGQDFEQRLGMLSKNMPAVCRSMTEQNNGTR